MGSLAAASGPGGPDGGEVLKWEVWLLLQDQSDSVGGRVDLGHLVRLAEGGEVARSLDPCSGRLVH